MWKGGQPNICQVIALQVEEHERQRQQIRNGWQFALLHGQLLFSTRACHDKPFVDTSINLLTFSLSGSSFAITSALCATAAGLLRSLFYHTSCSCRPFHRHSNPKN